MITLIKKTNKTIDQLTKDELKQVSSVNFPLNQYKLITNEMLSYLSLDMFANTWNNTKFPFEATSPDVWIKFIKNFSSWSSLSYQMLKEFPREFIEQNLSLIIDKGFGGYALGSWLVNNKYIKLSDYKEYHMKLNFEFSELCGPFIERGELFTYLKESTYLYNAIDDGYIEEYPILLHNNELKELGLNEIPELSIELLKEHSACKTGIRYAQNVLSAMDTTSTTWDNFVDFLHAKPAYFDRDLIAWIFSEYNDDSTLDPQYFTRD